MASTALKTDAEKKEYFDSPEVLDQKVEQLANYILASEHFVTFTGAGLSTSAGIPDYRSGWDTKLPTGPGCWEKAAQIQAAVKAGKKINQIPKNQFRATIQQAMPTNGHMALAELMERGMLKHCISQNVDGLHRKSGMPADKLTEVHGNTNSEICKKCQNIYMRDFRTRNAQKVNSHDTGRKCDDKKCNGDLMDTIINFGENLREVDLDTGFNHGQCADVMLCIGSSMRVNPAAQMAEETANRGGKLVIINLQNTPLTPMALHIYGKIDQVLELLMKKLNIAIPPFTLKRRAEVTLKNNALQIVGKDTNGRPFTIFKKTAYECKNGKNVAKMTFQGYYNEPELNVHLPDVAFNNGKVLIEMVYNPFSGKWESVTTIAGDQLKYDNVGQIRPMIIQNFAKPITVGAEKKAPEVAKKNNVVKKGNGMTSGLKN